MEAPSPARLFATVAGALLVVLGILGFFYSASFGQLDSYEEAFAGLQANGWLNLFYLATGSIGVLAAGASSRGYALTVGALYTALAIAGWGSDWLFLAIGVLGLAAAAGTPRRSLSEPRAQPAGKRA
ncbi:MAG TPA: DUF4383 domain-containing protein [Solirubrobacterales bacterium]|nr:DUF4383 domain-containing protein [Solirubrobacterales bacterium]